MRRLSRTALIVAGGFVAAVVMEIAIRAMAPQTLGPAIFERGPEGFGALKHNFEAHLVGPEYDIHVRLNSKGLRDIERGYAKPPGVGRLLVIGDSFTMGAGVELQQTYVKQLEAALRPAGQPRPYDVINAGVQNWGTGEQLVYLSREWLKYQPDAVLLAFQHTDLTDNIQHRVWELRGDQLTRVPFGPSEPTGSAVARVPGYRWLLNHSEAATYTRNAFFKWLYARDAARSRQELAQLSASVADGYQWRLSQHLLSEMHRRVAERGIPFFLVFAPSREEIQARRQRDATAGEIEAFLMKSAADESVPFLTLVPVLAAAGPIDALYYPLDGHWTPAAHRIVAGAMAEFLNDRLR
jgi:hypothetical protein